MKNLLIAILIGFAFISAAQAQSVDTEIRGQVKDPQGANLPGATVRLFGRDRTFSLVTATDSNGAYNFRHLAAGEYLIEAEASGFALAEAKSVTVARGQTTTLDIALQLSGLRSSVVVTASDTPQTVDEVSKALTSGAGASYWFMLEPLMMSRTVFDGLPKKHQEIILAASGGDRWPMVTAPTRRLACAASPGSLTMNG